MSRTGIIFYAPLHEDDRVCGILTGRYRQYQMRNIISSTYFGEPAATYLFLPDGTMIASSTEDAPENILDVFDDSQGLEQDTLPETGERYSHFYPDGHSGRDGDEKSGAAEPIRH